MPYVHEVVELDPVGTRTRHGGFGGRPVPVGESSVLVTRRRRSSTTALTLLDCRGGEALTVRGVPGELRGGVVDPDLGGAWLLAEFGLVRVTLVPALAVERVVRAGVPRHATYLHDLGGGRLAVSRIMGSTLTVIDTTAGTVAFRLRLPPAEQLVETPEGWWLHSAEGGESLLLSADRLKVERRLPLPSGRGSLTWRTSLFVAAGPRVGVGGQPVDVAYAVRPEHVVRLAAGWSHRVQATSPPIERLHHPVGVTPDETLHVETELGFVALDAVSLAEVARTAHPGPRWSAWHDGLSAVIVPEQSREREAVHVYRWIP